MRGGEEIFQHIQLLDRDGKAVTDPWLPDELWDETGTQLTLYIHPGRIKWGVLLRLLLGPVLEPDRVYTLVVGEGVLDADGRTWAFRPAAAWAAQEYKVVVDERLEDPCGNTPLRAFDVDADAPVPPPQGLTLPFRPK